MKKKFIIAAVTAGLLYTAIPLCYPQAEDVSEEIVLIIGEAKSFHFDAPQRVSIANPAIVDIPSVKKDEIILVGKSKGVTNLFVWDASGRSTYSVKVIPEDNEYLREAVLNILKNTGFTTIYIKNLEDQGKILLMGKVKSVEEKEKLKNVLGDLYNKITDVVEIDEEALIEIAVEVMELSTDAQKTLGFSLPRTVTLTEEAPVSGSKFQQIFKVNSLTRGTYSDGTLTPVPFSWRLDLLEAEGKANILSRPRVVCQSGKEAELLVGGEVPIFTTQVASAGGGGTQVEYKEYGIKLKIGPTVKEKGKVQLVLNVEISEIGTAETIGDPNAPTAKAYPLTKRNISTQLYLNDSETLAIGGLIKQKSEEDLEKFPWLADVPVLGSFFKHKTTKKGGGTGARGDTELFITLTPKIISYEEAPLLTEEEKKVSRQKEDFLTMYEDKKMPVEIQDYILEVQRKILGNLSYPATLLNTGWQGVVTLKLHLDSMGNLQNAQIVKSSGYKIFDEDALKLVKDISYPPFPSQISLEELKIEVPIVYKGSR